MTHGMTAYATSTCRCEQCKAIWATYMRNRRAQHIADGLCLECNEPASGGTRRCERHRLAMNQKQNARNQQKRKEA